MHPFDKLVLDDLYKWAKDNLGFEIPKDYVFGVIDKKEFVETLPLSKPIPEGFIHVR
jgi:hypothetical protein